MPNEQQSLFPDAELPARGQSPVPCVCPNCSAEFEEEDGIIPDSDTELHCRDCIHVCDECGMTTIDDDEIRVAYTGGNWRRSEEACLCSDCRFTCADCGRGFADTITPQLNADGKRICERCSEAYYSCDDCGDTIHQDTVQCDDSGTYCESCHNHHRPDDGDDAEDNDGRALHAYDYRPTPCYNTVPGERLPRCGNPFFGVEVEVDYPQYRPKPDRIADIEAANLGDSWYCKEDGSLNYGFEVVSHPGTWHHWQSVGLTWMKALSTAGYRSFDTSTCGMHVHVSKSFLTRLDELKLLALFQNNATLFKRLSRRCGGQEANYNTYASITRKPSTAELAKMLVMVECDGRSKKYVHKVRWHSRYTAINLEPEKTVEFRLFRGTLNPASFRRNLSLVVAVCHFVKWAGMHQLTADHFRVWCKVLGKNILGKGDAKILVSWLNESMANEPAADVAA